jgi:hypothetical protein
VNWRTPITLVVLLGVLLGAAYYGWNTIVSPGDDKKSAAPDEPSNQPCKKKTTIKKGSRIDAGDVRINVYNGGTRTGLAGDTMDGLVAKGFKRGVADNLPSNINAPWGNVSIVLPGGEAIPQVRLVRNQFIGVVKLIHGPADGSSIDVVVGDSFRGLRQTSQTFVRVNRPVKTCA